MATRADLADWVFEAVRAHGGRATIVEVASHIWENHEDELRRSGDLFFTWQYDIRWAAQRLRDSGKFRSAHQAQRRVWELVN